MTPSIVALIPARAGSKRCPGKNTRLLGGRTLIDWTVFAAHDSGIFNDIAICTDIDAIAWSYGFDVNRIDRATVPNDQPDIVWVREALAQYSTSDAFAILRPTSPFRTGKTINDAWQFFLDHQPADSLRAVRFAREPAQKMWVLGLGKRMTPLIPFYDRKDAGPMVHWHSSPSQRLPLFAIQTSSLEIAWTKTVTEQQSISGTSVVSYMTKENDPEHFAIDTEEDFTRAEQIVASRQHAAQT